MSKSHQIMALKTKGLTSRQIAEEVYGEATKVNMAYVRVVVGQRKGTGTSDHDRAYRKTANGREFARQRARRCYWRNRVLVLERLKLKRLAAKKAYPEGMRIGY